MPFSERADLKDERRPLLRDPVWHYNHRYGQGRGCDPEEIDEFLGRESARSQRFQWMLFLGVTFISIMILLATMGILIKLSETHPSVGPNVPTTTLSPVTKLPTAVPNSGRPMTASTSSIPSTSLSSTPPNIYVYVNESSSPANT